MAKVKKLDDAWAHELAAQELADNMLLDLCKSAVVQRRVVALLKELGPRYAPGALAAIDEDGMYRLVLKVVSAAGMFLQLAEKRADATRPPAPALNP